MNKKHKVVELAGEKIEVMEPKIVGESKGDILFLHGFNAPFQDFEIMFQVINQLGYNVYSFNLPGHAYSEINTHISWDSLAQITLEYIRKYLEGKEITLLGYSMGAGVIMRLLSNYAELNVSQVKLIAPFVYSMSLTEVEVVKGAIRLAGIGIEQIKSTYTDPEIYEYRKEIPVFSNPQKLLPAYAHLINQTPLASPENISCKVSVMFLGEDKIISKDKVMSEISQIKNHEFDYFAGLKHNLFYVKESAFTDLFAKMFNN